jgi:hypothetical protein
MIYKPKLLALITLLCALSLEVGFPTSPTPPAKIAKAAKFGRDSFLSRYWRHVLAVTGVMSLVGGGVYYFVRGKSTPPLPPKKSSKSSDSDAHSVVSTSTSKGSKTPSAVAISQPALTEDQKRDTVFLDANSKFADLTDPAKF